MKIKTLKKIIPISLIIASFVSSCKKDSTETAPKKIIKYEVDGYVIDKQNNIPISNIDVTLIRVSVMGQENQGYIVPATSCKTNSDGYFKLNFASTDYCPEINIRDGYIKNQLIRIPIDSGITQLNNIYVTTCGYITVKLNRTDVISPTDTLFVYADSIAPRVLPYQNINLNNNYFIGQFNEGIVHLNWTYKTTSETKSYKDSIYCHLFKNNIFTLNF